MENLKDKKKIIMYISIAVLVLLIISVIYFMINSKLEEKEYNSEMEDSFIKFSDNVIYDYNYSLKDDIVGSLVMKFDIKDKVVVEKSKNDTKVEEGMLLAKYDGKEKITVKLPKPIITSHEIKGDKLKKDDLVETNKVVNAAKIQIENKISSTNAAEELTERFKIVLYEFLKAKGYKQIEFK